MKLSTLYIFRNIIFLIWKVYINSKNFQFFPPSNHGNHHSTKINHKKIKPLYYKINVTIVYIYKSNVKFVCFKVTFQINNIGPEIRRSCCGTSTGCFLCSWSSGFWWRDSVLGDHREWHSFWDNEIQKSQVQSNACSIK